MNSCSYCQMFTNKVYRHPIKPKKVPERCLEENYVDLFGPLSSKIHTVVTQDLVSRYPLAKLAKSTSAKPMFPVLEDVYDTFGNPIQQKVTTDPLLILRKWKNLLKIEIFNRLKHQPYTFLLIMEKRLWSHWVKQWKLVSFKIKEKRVLYLHICWITVILPSLQQVFFFAQIIFWDEYHSNLPHKSLSDQKISTARIRDQNKKLIDRMFTIQPAWQKKTFFRLVIAFFLKTTDGISNSTHIFYRINFALLTFELMETLY